MGSFTRDLPSQARPEPINPEETARISIRTGAAAKRDRAANTRQSPASNASPLVSTSDDLRTPLQKWALIRAAARSTFCSVEPGQDSSQTGSRAFLSRRSDKDHV